MRAAKDLTPDQREAWRKWWTRYRPKPAKPALIPTSGELLQMETAEGVEGDHQPSSPNLTARFVKRFESMNGLLPTTAAGIAEREAAHGKTRHPSA